MVTHETMSTDPEKTGISPNGVLDDTSSNDVDSVDQEKSGLKARKK